MAQDEVNSIAETMRSAAQRQLQAKQLAQEAQARADQLQLEKDKFNEEVNQHSISNKAAKALLDANLAAHQAGLLQASQQMGTTYQNTGVAPAGATFSPAASSTPGGTPNFTPANSADATSQVMQIPGMGAQTVLSPEQAAARQSNIDETLAAPKRKTEELKQGLETQRQVAVTTATQAEETKRQATINAQNQAAAIKLKKMEIEGENYRNSVSTATQLKIAQMPYAIFNNMDPQTRTAIVQPSVDALNSGDMSATQVQKEFNEKGMAGAGTAVISAFMGSGGVPPTDKQVQFKQQIKPIIDSLPLIQQYINLLPKSISGPGGVMAGLTHPDMLNPQLEATMKQITFNIANVAKTIGGDAGQRLQKALLEPAEGGYLPSKYKSTAYNISNFNKLMDVVNSSIDSNLGSLPPAQRSHIKNDLGLTKIQPMGSATSPQTSGTIHKYYDAQGNEIPSGAVK